MYPQRVGAPPTLGHPDRPVPAPNSSADDADFLTFIASLNNPRAPSGSALRLTPRHIETLDLLLFHRALGADQFQIGAGYPLGPNSAYSCQRVLTKLYRHEYVDRLPRAQSEPAVYLFTRRCLPALRLLRERWGDQYVKAHLTAIGQLGHLLGINDVAVRVRRGCAEIGLTLRFWQRSQDVERILRAEQTIPDAYFQILRQSESGPKTAAFFLELQHANRSLKTLRAKLERYGQLYYTGRYEQLFGTRALRVLFVFSSEAGVPTASRVSAGVAEASRLEVTVARFVGLDDLKALSPMGILTARIWRAPAQDEPVSLFEGQTP